MTLRDFIKAANQSKEIMLKTIVNSGKKTNDLLQNSFKTLHVSSAQQYPAAAALPLPINIDPAETTRFSPQRSRDISANAILSHQSTISKTNIDVTLDSSTNSNDPHVDSYDCFGAVSLNSSMQSNVPSPFGGLHKFTHLNMPGGQWSQESKFMSHNLHNSHYINLRREMRASWSTYDQDATTKKGTATAISNGFIQQRFLHNSLLSLHDININKRRFSSSKQTENTEIVNEQSNKLTRKEMLKKAFKEYGATVVVFHVGISLTSLGMFYLLVSSGVDLVPIIEKIGLGSTALSSKAATGAGTFVIAYAIHKVFAPVRISITLGATPFIVKYLRRKGFLKQPNQS